MNLEELLKSNRPPKKDEITDGDLAKLFMKYKGLLKQVERDEAFWEATHENIRISYAKLDELVEARTAELRKKNEQLQQEITERKRAEEKLEHLNLVLRAVRNVNQLITKEKDRDRLLKGACENLVETRGYNNAWIALLDESGKLETAAEAGLGDDFQPMIERLKRGELTHCGGKALEQSEILVIEDPPSTCGDCPLVGKYQGRAGATIRLEYEGSIYGLMSVSIPAHVAEDKEEQSLFKEVADDIAFALYAIELEGQRKLAEEALQEAHNNLEKKVEERTAELQNAREALVRKERLAVLGQLSGGVGHELRNPLGVISNAVYFLQTVLSDADEKTSEYLGIISSEVGNAEKIISDLLDFSRTKSAEREEITVADLVNRVLAKQNPPVSINVTTEIDPGLPTVHVDPRQMEQVLTNLVSNACQAMPEGGDLTIRAKEDEGKVCISIADTGGGMFGDVLGKIFEPLYTTRARGIGLGLSVSKNLVEVNEGSIEAESEEGKGSAFTVILPAKGEVS